MQDFEVSMYIARERTIRDSTSQNSEARTLYRTNSMLSADFYRYKFIFVLIQDMEFSQRFVSSIKGTFLWVFYIFLCITYIINFS